MKGVIFTLCFLCYFQTTDYRYPIREAKISLTSIGEFGILRKARPGIQRHLHTGIDILPPLKNYQSDEPIFPISRGVVISKRTDGPYAQIILEHDNGDFIFWSVYEHIAEIQVDLFQPVDTNTQIARFFKALELDQIGWQFNHFHFEILKVRPIRIKADSDNPERMFNSYSLSCFTPEDLHSHFHNPQAFLKSNISN